MQFFPDWNIGQQNEKQVIIRAHGSRRWFWYGCKKIPFCYVHLCFRVFLNIHDLNKNSELEQIIHNMASWFAQISRWGATKCFPISTVWFVSIIIMNYSESYIFIKRSNLVDHKLIFFVFKIINNNILRFTYFTELKIKKKE